MTKKYFLLIFTAMLAFSCTDSERANDVELKDDVITTEQSEKKGHDMKQSLQDGEMKSTIELIAIEQPPMVAGATLRTESPKTGAKMSAGKVDVSYSVDNFSLGTATGIKTDYDLAESEKGQHIHAILNNEPYMAHYEPKFSKELGEGQYLMLSFLSRSYHLSLKGENQSELIQFTVGNPDQDSYKLDQPFLFYSRPKGEYDIDEHADILLDFYLVNCDLTENGYQVEAKIAGYDFTIDRWQPYVIKGLKEGQHDITLTLVDGDGEAVDVPFNPVTRKIKIVSSASVK